MYKHSISKLSKNLNSVLQKYNIILAKILWFANNTLFFYQYSRFLCKRS